MDTISDIQTEQTPFKFRGDEQALRTVVDRAVYALPGSRIRSRTIPGHLAADVLSLSDAAWIERYAEAVRGVDVRRLRAIWIGDARLEGTGPILSFSYRSAYFDRPDEDDTTLSALRRRNVNPRDPEWGHMKLHVKALKATGKNTEGKIEAPALLRFAVDAILLAIEEAGREVQTAAPTGDAPSESVDQGTPSTGKQAGEPLPEKPPKWGHGWLADDYFDWWYRRRKLGFDDTIKGMGKTAGYTGFYQWHMQYRARYGQSPKPDDESRFKPS